MFTSILSESTGTLSITDALICTVVSLFLGFTIAVIYISQERKSKNMAVSLVILPALVQIVIMMVNGNLGTGIAVMGAFGLVRFRSAPGSSKEICYIFFAMAIGIATGMGYLTFAAATTILISIALIALAKVNFGDRGNTFRKLKMTIPENLNYSEAFDDIFEKYTNNHDLLKVKTSNLGSLYELTYNIDLKDLKQEKSFIDELRCRNGNLTINCSVINSNVEELL